MRYNGCLIERRVYIMNVQELIAHLQKLPPETKVFTFTGGKFSEGQTEPLEIGTNYPDLRNSDGTENLRSSLESDNFSYTERSTNGTIYFGN